MKRKIPKKRSETAAKARVAGVAGPARIFDDAGAVRSVTKALEILSYISSSTRGVGVRELGRAVGLGKSPTSRIVLTLECQNFLRQEPDTLRYRLGPAVLEIAAGHHRSHQIRQVARPHMDELARRTGETVFLGLLNGSSIAIVDRVDSTNMLRIVAELGSHEPVYCTALGKVLLASLAEDQRQAIIGTLSFYPFTKNTAQTAQRVVDDIERTQSAGYGIDDEEHYEGVRCVAVAIRNDEHRTVAGISISGPTVRLNNARIPDLTKVLKATGLAISRELGFKPQAVKRSGAA